MGGSPGSTSSYKRGGGGAQPKGWRKALPVFPGCPSPPPPSTGERWGGPKAAILATLEGYQCAEQPNHTHTGLLACSANPLPSSGD